MDTKKILYLVELLREETEGMDRELDLIYSRALAEHEEVKNLEFYLNNYSFFGSTGSSIYKKSSSLLDEVYRSGEDLLENLKRIKQISQLIYREGELCEELLLEPLPFKDDFTVIEKKMIQHYIKAMEEIASTIVYLLVLYNGLDALSGLYFSEINSLTESIYLINKIFLPKIKTIKRPDYAWLITKRDFHSDILFDGEGFCLEHLSVNSIEYFNRNYRTEQISTHIYLNVDAFEKEEKNIPYCWGVGNILSVVSSFFRLQ